MDESQGKCSRQKLKQRQEEYLLFLVETAVYFIYPRDAHLQSMDGTIHSGLSPTKSITKQDNDHTDLFTDQCDGGNPLRQNSFFPDTATGAKLKTTNQCT